MTRQFWIAHAVWPGVVCCAVLLVLSLFELDPGIARSWAYSPAHGWMGTGTWWANDLIHTGGRDLVRLTALVALLVWLTSFVSARHADRRRGALYLLLSILLTTGLAGLIKLSSNIDCPWSLAGFGGGNPYVALFGDRPDELPRAQCFPGAHSASGFALMAFYFLLRDRRPRAARAALLGALALGALFAFGQQARGAHFLSHDLTSAFIAWYVLLGLYALMMRSQATDTSTPRT